MCSLPTSAQENKTEMLLGVITKQDLQEKPFASWYNASSDGYNVDEASLKNLENLIKGVDVKIVMGTWCHDSKREVPRFYKILSSQGIAESQVEMIAVNTKKHAPNGETDNMAITNTPTFIFYKEGVELNRIVETPVEALEIDMMKILKGETYRHSKMSK